MPRTCPLRAPGPHHYREAPGPDELLLRQWSHSGTERDWEYCGSMCPQLPEGKAESGRNERGALHLLKQECHVGRPQVSTLAGVLVWPMQWRFKTLHYLTNSNVRRCRVKIWRQASPENPPTPSFTTPSPQWRWQSQAAAAPQRASAPWPRAHSAHFTHLGHTAGL